MERYFGAMLRHPWVTLAAVALSVVAGLHGIVDLRTGELKLHLDTSANALLPTGDPDKEYYDYIRLVFGSDETLLVVIGADEVFTTRNLERVQRLVERIEAVDGVHHVEALTTALHIRAGDDDVEIGPLVSAPIPEDAETLDRIRREALDNPLYAGALISKDGKTTALLVYFVEMTDREFLARGIDDEISEIAHEEAAGADVWITGTPHIKVVRTRMLIGDLTRELPIIFGLLAVVLVFSFRTVRGVLIPLATIVIGLVWTLGTVAALGYSLNLITSLVPALLMVLGLSYSVHVVSEYYSVLRERGEGGERWPPPGTDSGSITLEAVGDVWLPVALTGLTTGIGFISMQLSDLDAIAEFGLLSVFGVIFTVVASLTFTPCALELLPIPKRSARAGSIGGPFTRFAESMGRFDTNYRTPILVGSGVLLAVAVVGISWMRVGTEHIASFRPDAEVRTDYEAINRSLDGANPFYVVVEASFRDAFKDPANLRELESLVLWLKNHEDVGSATSVVDCIELMNRGLNGGDPDAFAIPTSRSLVAQILFFGCNEESYGLNKSADLAAISVRARVVDAAELSELVRDIDDRLRVLPGHLTGRATGNPILLNGMIDKLVRGQAQSLGTAFLFIYAVLAIMFLNFRIGLLALIPNVIPIAAYYGVLGITGIPLSPATSLIGPMALGIAVDDTIHYFARFNAEAKRLGDEHGATISALRTVGRPVTYTTIALCIGFMVLTTSDLQNWIQVGALGSFTLGFAWLVDFTLTPALCSGLRVVTIWDALTLDLGSEPQKTIAVFKGLSHAQARIVALMASVVEVPKGTRLIRAGEQGEEMYVVIDGKLQASVEGEGGPRMLDAHGRGDAVGEVGIFYEQRTANVDVVEDARLLRVTQAHLDRLMRRYPRIAAQVLRNLNESVAGRLARTTRALAQAGL